MSAASTLTRVFALLLLTLLTLTSVCLYRTFVLFQPTKVEGECKQTESHQPITDVDNLVARFSRAIQFRTVTTGPKQVDEVELLRFINWLQTAYPTLHNSKLVKYERVANFSLLYTIKGSNPDLKPYMLCSHLDVVPVELDKWTVDPFAGVVKDDYLYGRGTIDVKDTLMAIFEALEHLFKNENFVPERGIIVAFGHDEEGSGVIGANEISKILQNRAVQPEFILDEGTFISKQSFPGIWNNLIAFVGIAEKGYLTIELKSKGEAGHSSMPPKNSAIVQIAKAAAKFDADILPSQFGKGPEVFFMEALAPYADFPFNIMYSNLWLFGPLINYFFGKSIVGNSLVRTTSVPTIIRGGFKDNILPSEASVIINHRIHPGQSVEQVLQFDRNLINNEEIDINVVHEFEPHPYSPYDEQSFGYQNIKTSVLQVFVDTIVVPGIMIASTDTKHYLPLTKNIYRFSPVVMNSTETRMFHGHDERIAITNYVKIVNFYHHLIRSSDKTKLERKPVREEL